MFLLLAAKYTDTHYLEEQLILWTSEFTTMNIAFSKFVSSVLITNTWDESLKREKVSFFVVVVS